MAPWIWIMDIRNLIMDIHNSIVDIHKYIHNSIMDIHNSITDIHNCKPIKNKAAIMNIHNWLWISFMRYG